MTRQALYNALGNTIPFDLKERPLEIGGRKSYLLYLFGYSDAIALERILFSLLNLPSKDDFTLYDIMQKTLSFASADVTTNAEKAADELLRGSSLILVDQQEGYLVLDARAFLMRPPEEPEKDRTLRGPHIGLNESLISNIVQVRRLMRTPLLQVEQLILGTKVKNEVAILSLKGKYDTKLMDRIRKRLTGSKLPTLSMTQETLAELLFPTGRLGILNPFPRVRYTERPDVIAATLTEGKIVILCDNTPSAMLIPESIFDFFEETDDYYFPPITASYLRIVRALVFLCSVFLIPIWLITVQMAHAVPETFTFLLTDTPYAVPLFLQFLLIEIAIDGLKMASLNTPNTLSNSFSVIGGLLLGEFAVKSGWFVPQTILYSAFTGIANFIPTNFELGYSFKFMRISLILLVEWLGIWGLLLGIAIWLIILCSTKSIAGKSYLYPFLPFDPKGIKKLLIRSRSGKEKLL